MCDIFQLQAFGQLNTVFHLNMLFCLDAGFFFWKLAYFTHLVTKLTFKHCIAQVLAFFLYYIFSLVRQYKCVFMRVCFQLFLAFMAINSLDHKPLDQVHFHGLYCNHQDNFRALAQIFLFSNLYRYNQHTSFRHDIPKFHMIVFQQPAHTCPQQVTFFVIVIKKQKNSKITIYIYQNQKKMHKNRLIQLSQISGRSDRIGSRIQLPPKFQAEVEQFEEIDEKINRMMANNQQLAELRKKYLKTADPNKQKQLLHDLNKASQQNRSLMNKLEKSIKQINQTQKKDFEAGKKGNTIQVTRITQRASKAISDFKDNQQKFSNGVKDNIRRQAIIIQQNISQEEVQDIMANPQKGQEMLRAKLLNEPSVELQNAVSDIIDKYNDILALQKSMHQCLQMMQQMALLVALTGQQLNNIQNCIDQAQDYTKIAEEKMEKAVQHHKSGNKKLCCIIMLLVAAIGAVVIPIVITKT